jgi:hypothetical protein
MRNVHQMRRFPGFERKLAPSSVETTTPSADSGCVPGGHNALQTHLQASMNSRPSLTCPPLPLLIIIRAKRKAKNFINHVDDGPMASPDASSIAGPRQIYRPTSPMNERHTRKGRLRTGSLDLTQHKPCSLQKKKRSPSEKFH